MNVNTFIGFPTITTNVKTHNGFRYVVENYELHSYTSLTFWYNCFLHRTKAAVIAWIEDVYGNDLAGPT